MTPEVQALIDAAGGILAPSSLTGAPKLFLIQTKEHLTTLTRSVVVASPSGVLNVTEPSQIARLEFINRWDVNAWALLDATKPIVMFHAGVPFCLYDYFCQILSLPEVLPEYDGESERAGQGLRPTVDFSALATQDWPTEIPLSHDEKIALGADADEDVNCHVDWTHYVAIKPVSQTRKGMVSELYMYALLFLFFHEQAHIENGHLQYLCRKGAPLALCEFTNSEVDAAEERMALELDADYTAATKSFIVLPSLPSWDVGDKTLDIIVRSYRLQLFAIGALMFLIDHQVGRNRLGIKGWMTRLFGTRRSSHPSGMDRLLVCTSAIKKRLDAMPPSGKIFDLAMNSAMSDLMKVSSHLHLPYEDLRLGKSGPSILARLAKLKPQLVELARTFRSRVFVGDKEVSRHVALGVAQLQLGNSEVALNEFTLALAGDLNEEERTMAFQGAAIAAQRLGRTDEANAYIREEFFLSNSESKL
ncbi:MAG TPA: hypothetical protein VGE64_13265 [Xanthomonadaceae bacterium]